MKLSSHRMFLSNLTPSLPWLTSAWPLTPAMRYFRQVSSYQIWWPYRAFLSNLTLSWPQLTATWPLTLECITLWSEVLPIKLGGHREFLKQFDPWMTFEIWRGRFEQLTTNLESPFPTTQSSFMRQSTTKCIAGQAHKQMNWLTDKVVFCFVFVFADSVIFPALRLKLNWPHLLVLGVSGQLVYGWPLMTLDPNNALHVHSSYQIWWT